MAWAWRHASAAGATMTGAASGAGGSPLRVRRRVAVPEDSLGALGAGAAPLDLGRLEPSVRSATEARAGGARGAAGGLARSPSSDASESELPFHSIRWPRWLPWPSNVAAVLSALFALLLMYDASYNALGAANGRFISLVDTVHSVVSYRAGLPRWRRSGVGVLTPRRFVRVLVDSFAVKFAAQTLVSLALGATPVVLKGVRHFGSFFLGVLLVWFCPGDVVYLTTRRSPVAKLLVAMAIGLYKLRKALFAVEASAAVFAQQPAELRAAAAFTLVLINLDGNSVLKRALLWLEAEEEDSSQDPGAALLLARARAAVLNRDLLFQLLREYVVPDLVVTALLLYLGGGPQAIELKCCLLVYFLARQGTFELLAQMHERGRAADDTPSPPTTPLLRKGKLQQQSQQQQQPQQQR